MSYIHVYRWVGLLTALKLGVAQHRTVNKYYIIVMGRSREDKRPREGGKLSRLVSVDAFLAYRS